MITLTETYPKKLPGITSIFVEFEYNSQIIDILKKHCDVLNYDKHTKVWEIPVTSISEVIDDLSLIDDIQLNLV